MSGMTLGDLSLVVADLLERRASLLKSSGIGAVYLPIIEHLNQKILSLPAALRAARPYGDALSDVDAIFDGSAQVLWFLTETALRNPKTSSQRKDAAARIRGGLLSSLEITRASYKDEAIYAKSHRSALKDLEADLRLFQVEDARTLYDVAVEFLDAGDTLDDLLSDRATLEAASEVDRSAAKTLRSVMLGVLSRCRRALADEVTYSPNLPRNLESQIFGYLDEVQRQVAPVRIEKPND
jgi:hypothetical protein